MQHLRRDIARMYEERDELFAQRWSLSADDYRRRFSDLNARIRGYETLLCENFPESLRVIFPPTETKAD